MHDINYLTKSGFSLLKIKPKDKMPVGKNWQKGKPLTNIQALKALEDHYNLGVRTGVASKISKNQCLVVIDFDIRTKEASVKEEALSTLKSLVGDLNRYPIVISGSFSGSAHIYLKCDIDSLPKSQYINNTSQWNIMLCTSGKQVLIPPSIHPKTNMQYKWLRNPQEYELVDIKTLPLWNYLKFEKEKSETEDRFEKEESYDTIQDLPVKDRAKRLILLGDEEGLYPSRSEAIFSCIHSLVQGGVNTDNIVEILTNPEYVISEGVLERAKGDLSTARNWLLPQIKKASHAQLEHIKDLFKDEFKHDLTPKPLGEIVPKDIRPTEWLIEGRLAKKFMTLTVAPGGSGKTTLTIQEAVSIASGVDCCGQKMAEQGPVWIFNNEDPIDELHRRIAAILEFYGLTFKQLEGKVFLNSGRMKKERLLIANEDPKKGKYLYDDNIEVIERSIEKYGIKLLIIDPFARCHYLNENDNSAMDMVADIFTGIADRQNCAINLVHHSRKLGKAEFMAGNADSIRGASSLVNAARIAHTLTTMSQTEAEGFGLDPTQHIFYSRLDSAKNNLSAPTTEINWYKKESVTIANGEKRGILKTWEAPKVLASGITEDKEQLVLQMINDAWFEKRPYKFSKDSDSSIYKTLKQSPFNLQKGQIDTVLYNLMNSGKLVNETEKGALKGLRALLVKGESLQ